MRDSTMTEGSLWAPQQSVVPPQVTPLQEHPNRVWSAITPCSLNAGASTAALGLQH